MIKNLGVMPVYIYPNEKQGQFSHSEKKRGFFDLGKEIEGD
jgi:hypothetical protein